jgi:hypothetical protein
MPLIVLPNPTPTDLFSKMYKKTKLGLSLQTCQSNVKFLSLLFCCGKGKYVSQMSITFIFTSFALKYDESQRH